MHSIKGLEKLVCVRERTYSAISAGALTTLGDGTYARRLHGKSEATPPGNTKVMADRDEFAENRLLAALPANVHERLQSDLELVSLALGKVLYEAHDALSYVYFPTTAIVSLLYTMEDGSTAEMGIVGRDGVVGIAVFMGGDTTPNRAVVQSAGDAFRLALKPFRAEFQRTGGITSAVVVIHASAAYSDVADRGLQPTTLRRAAIVPLSVVEPRPSRI
jgi:hypothetical protein